MIRRIRREHIVNCILLFPKNALYYIVREYLETLMIETIKIVEITESLYRLRNHFEIKESYVG